MIIIQGNNVQYLRISDLFDTGADEQGKKDDHEFTDTTSLNLKIDDSLDFDILDVFYTDNPDTIQVIGQESTQKVVMIATWDLNTNSE